MSNNRRELPENRLATTDEKGHRLWLYPADVKGRFRSLRNHTNWVLIAIFLVMPWIRIGGEQSILLDVAHRRFVLFGAEFWGHDAPMLVFLLGAVAFGITLATALWGRIWCGWACPQTVFIDGVFRKIERWIEGDAVVRRKLDEAPWSAEKLLKKSAKWGLFSLASLVIAHSFLAYFVGTEELAVMVRRSPGENPARFGVMVFAFGLTLFDFGWFREQFCTILCPYGKFQSVLMDDQSLAVVYDTSRGEPRKGRAPAGEPAGDCVNCYRCVQVCPTGIDIRRGVQLECIACTACIDACDEVMRRLKKPTGLIRYGSTAELAGNKRSILRPRTFVYSGVMLAIVGGLTWALSHRSQLNATFLRAKGDPYETVNAPKELVINHYKLDLKNQTRERLLAHIEIDEALKSRGVEVVTTTPEVALDGRQSRRVDLFFRFPKDVLTLGKVRLPVRVIAVDESRQVTVEEKKEISLVGPFR